MVDIQSMFKSAKDCLVCFSQEEAYMFCRILHNNKYKWCDNTSFLSSTQWSDEFYCIIYYPKCGTYDCIYKRKNRDNHKALEEFEIQEKLNSYYFGQHFNDTTKEFDVMSLYS